MSDRSLEPYNRNSKNETTKLAILRTKLANKRTTMSFVRTGLAILLLAVVYKKKAFIILGLLMIISSNIEYYFINYFLSNNKIDFTGLQIFDLLPILYSILFIIAMYYYEFDLKKKF